MDIPPRAGAGRPKGAQNKLSKSVKECLAAAAEELGGVERVVAWAKEDPANERIFWSQMYTKLIAASGSKDDPVHMEHGVSSLNAVYDRIHTPSETEAG